MTLRLKTSGRGIELPGWVEAYGLLLIMGGLVLVFTILEPSILNVDNMIGIVFQASIIGIMAVCSTFVLILGGIDLSVGPVLALAGLLASFILEANEQAFGLAMLAGLLTGVVVGLFNGLTIARFKLPPFVVTLAMLSVTRGIALLLSEGSLHLIRGPEEFLFIGNGSLLGLPFPIYLFALVALVMFFIQEKTPFGMAVFAIGENEAAARLCGLPLIRTKALVYTLSSLGAAAAGLILASQVHTATATYGEGIELDVIAAIVLGGTSLMGGSGSVHRSVLGALLIGIINNGLSILNVSLEIQLMVKGLIIVLALALDNYFRTGRKR
jgi:ribose/xylose/arabinose/galactoside ABC-type transport system permease subunit